MLDKDQRVVLTGEIKLPYQKDGNSPYNASLIKDARQKAARAQSPFFFTWNVNDFVLWETVPSKTTLWDHNYKLWSVTRVHRESHMDLPSTNHAIQTWLTLFLNEFSQILRGTAPIGAKPPDEKFIDALESSLHLPIRLNFDKLEELYKKARFKSKLDKWMRDEQGWIIYDNPDGIRDNLERASKFACYALVNKLVFHEALLKRYGRRMDKLNVPDHIDTGDELRLHLEKYFLDAKDITGDYETVFGEEHKSLGNLIPFYSDSAVTHWRDIINQIHQFDFSKLDYEIIGNIFELLISPEERHRFGQFYTRVEVVDLINSFCIRVGDEKLMDPACGGGTFLVRAYARKREINPRRKHGELLSDLFGVDISHFATHLTTINLATRDLIDAENYPQIVRNDFFDIRANTIFTYLPKHIKAKGLGKIQQKEVVIPLLDAVIGNPPYVRQEDIPKSNKRIKGRVKRGTKDYYQKLIQREANVKLSGRSDLHCYFWPHAATFLKEDGYLCLLTSSQWLDVEYGFRLQEWILKNFEIVAVLESIDEPWFVGARVATTITILKRQKDEAKRMKKTVRFIQLRRAVREILVHDGTTAGAIVAADQFRDEVLALRSNTINERYRARLVKQGDLWEEGVRLGTIMRGLDEYSEDEEQPERYYGGKWGVYLRAPDLWFEILDKYGENFSPLVNIAKVRFGVKTGKDCFFFPKDCSDEKLQEAEHEIPFEFLYGVPMDEVASGKVKLVLCGEGRGEVRPIESEYLEPEVHSLMEVDGFSVSPEDCSRHILLVSDKREKLKGKLVLDYIEWGEKQGFHLGATCASRVTSNREWYDLTGHKRGAVFWPKAQQYKHAIPINEKQLQCNCNLYDVHLPEGISPSVMAGILNSTIVALSKFQYGRPVGVEGNLKTEVVDVNIMLIPDPREATKKQLAAISNTFEKLKGRKTLQFLSERRLREMVYKQSGKEDKLEELSDLCELDMEDRRELDDAVLQMLGIRKKQQRQELIDELYAYLREFFEMTRQKEEKAIRNKKIAKRRGRVQPAEIATQIFQEIVDNEPRLVRQYDPEFIDKAKPYDTFEFPTEGNPQHFSDMFSAHGVEFRKGKTKRTGFIETKSMSQAELIILLASSGVRGLVRVPHEAAECLTVLNTYERFVRERERRIWELIEERTTDEEMQEKIYDSLMALFVKR